MKAQASVLVTIEVGMLLLGLFLIAGHFADPSQYGTQIFVVGEVLSFFGLLFGLGASFSDLGFVLAFIIAVIFLLAVTGIFWFFHI